MEIPTSRHLVFWTPRLLTIVYIAFVSMFALDVFGARLGLWQTVVALTMHLIPAFVLVAVLVLAWRRPWIGAVFFGILALGFVLGPLQPPPVRSRPWQARLVADVFIAGPVFLIAGLFLVEWLRRKREIDRLV